MRGNLSGYSIDSTLHQHPGLANKDGCGCVRCTFLIAATAASLNQGKCSKVRHNSLPCNESQIPSLEIRVTSSPEVFIPRVCDFILVFFNKFLNWRELAASQPVILCQFDLGFKPELCFATASLNVDMNPRLLSGEKEKRNPSSRNTVGLTG